MDPVMTGLPFRLMKALKALEALQQLSPERYIDG
jgi:hypothetical protein